MYFLRTEKVAVVVIPPEEEAEVVLTFVLQRRHWLLSLLVLVRLKRTKVVLNLPDAEQPSS